MRAVLKDLLYGGRNEYLDLIRVLGALGAITFLALSAAEFARRGAFDKWEFVAAWVALLGGTAGAIWGRTRIDRAQREDAERFRVDAGGEPR
jgi:hypothetical protein